MSLNERRESSFQIARLASRERLSFEGPGTDFVGSKFSKVEAYQNGDDK
jgi:hypothetical protein